MEYTLYPIKRRKRVTLAIRGVRWLDTKVRNVESRNKTLHIKLDKSYQS